MYGRPKQKVRTNYGMNISITTCQEKEIAMVAGQRKNEDLTTLASYVGNSVRSYPASYDA